MKHLAQALAILSKAENALQSDLNDERGKAIAQVEMKYAMRLRAMKDTKTVMDSILVQWQRNRTALQHFQATQKHMTRKERRAATKK
jgi:hypothetical protein